MTGKIYAEICRMLGYGWGWRLITSIINRRNRTRYRFMQLRAEFEATKAGKPLDVIDVPNDAEQQD